MKTPILAGLAALTLSLVVATPLVTQAAPGQGGAHAGVKMKKIADALGLTDAQKAQIKPILQSARQQAEAIKADTSLAPAARQAKLKELARSTNQQVMAILTPDQQAKLKAMRLARRGKA